MWSRGAAFSSWTTKKPNTSHIFNIPSPTSLEP
jgi:hypothetical protein